MMRQESFNFGIMREMTITAFMPARQRQITWRYVLKVIDAFTLHCTCTDKIKRLYKTKKSKFHFVQYLKQIVPCESSDKGVSSRGSRVRTKCYGSMIDSGSDRVLINIYNLTITLNPFYYKKIISVFMQSL